MVDTGLNSFPTLSMSLEFPWKISDFMPNECKIPLNLIAAKGYSELGDLVKRQMITVMLPGKCMIV